MAWLDLSLKNPHKIIDIEYQNPCNVCAALSFEGFQETREPSEDTPQSFRASSIGFIWGSWTQSIQLSECNSKLKCCAFTKKNTIILMNFLLMRFFLVTAPPKKKNNRSVNFPMQSFNHEGHGDHFCTGFQPTEITQEMQGSLYYEAKPMHQLYWQNTAKPTPEITTTFCCLFWFSKKKLIIDHVPWISKKFSKKETSRCGTPSLSSRALLRWELRGSTTYSWTITSLKPTLGPLPFIFILDESWQKKISLNKVWRLKFCYDHPHFAWNPILKKEKNS